MKDGATKDRVLSADDLAVLGRRGELDDAERRRLEVSLDASPASKALHDLGVEYDTLPTDDLEDAALLERAVTRSAERWLARPEGVYTSRRGRKRAVVLAVLAALGAASAAAATVGVVRWVNVGAVESSEHGEAEPGEGVRSPTPRVRVTNRAKAAVDTLPFAGEPTGDEPAGEERPGDVASPPGRSKADRAPTGSSNATAAQLFSEANELRKSGRTAEAVSGYRKLMQAYPASAEAALSHVLLGRILLREGQLAKAQAEFQRYLDGNGAGSLAEEALHGSATALAGMGRSAEERRVWQSLLARFPSSLYAGKAHERLAELE